MYKASIQDIIQFLLNFFFLYVTVIFSFTHRSFSPFVKGILTFFHVIFSKGFHALAFYIIKSSRVFLQKSKKDLIGTGPVSVFLSKNVRKYLGSRFKILCRVYKPDFDGIRQKSILLDSEVLDFLILKFQTVAKFKFHKNRHRIQNACIKA